MKNYYYLVASLPGLVPLSPSPLGLDAFLIEAARHLDPSDAAELSALLAARREDVRSVFARAWIDHERQLRNAIARARALRSGLDAGPFIREHAGFRVATEHAVHEAFARPVPSEREAALDRCRWTVAEELAQGHPFALAAVFSYAVRMVINERWRPLTPEAGRERFEEMVGVVGVSSQEAAGWAGLAQV